MMKQKLLNVGVIGLGMGRAHAEGVKNTEGACLYALCDIDRARADEVAKELEVSRVFTDYRDMIADPAIDAVIIASPDQDHRRMVLDSLDAGKHILCEKPLALTREDMRSDRRSRPQKRPEIHGRPDLPLYPRLPAGKGDH